MSTDTPMDAIAALARVIKDAASFCGLELRQVAAVPDVEGDGIHVIQVAFSLPQEDDAFHGIIQATAEAEAEAERDEQIAELERRLKEEGGFLD